MKKKLLTLLALIVGAVGSAWGDYSTRVLTNNDLTSTWSFPSPGSSSVSVSTTGLTDNELVLISASNGGDIKFHKDGYLSCKGTSSIYIPVPSGSAGTISMTVNGASDSRYFQLYINGESGTSGQRLYSKLNEDGISSDGKKGPQTFSFTSSDITTYNNKTYLHLKDNNAEMKVATFAITLTTGTYATKAATSEALKSSAAVKVGDDALTLDATTNGYSISGDNNEIITLSNDISVTSAPTIIKLVKTISYDDSSTSDADVDVTFDGTITSGYFIGTASIGLTGNEKEYTVKVKQDATPTIDLSETSGSISLNSYMLTGTQTVTLTGSNLTNGTYNVTADITGTTISPATFTVADGAVNQEFTITSSANSAETTVFTFGSSAMGIDAPTYTLSYSKAAKRTLTQSDVTASTTWDWSKAGENIVELTENTTDPSRSDEFVMSNIAEVNNDANFNSQALKVVCQFPTRGSDHYFQGNSVKFTTTVPGIVQVYFSNTSNRDDTNKNRRYLYINGNNTGVYTLNTTFTSAAIYVPAGEVVIDAYTGEDTPAATMVRISKIVFAVHEAIAITCEGGYASYSCDRALDFSNSGAEAYIIKSTTENSAALTKVTKVPANTGIIVKGTKGETVNVAIATGTTDDVTGNLLKGTVNTPKVVEKDEAYGLSKADGLFHLMNAGTIPANKAYLLASDVFQSGTAPVLSLEFSNGDATAIDDVRSKMEDVRGDFYNLNGQRVSQPTKGLYIVNGKKVIMK